ncbi:MAG: PHP domain-containing protein [Eubacteriales bacterium]
MNENDYKFRWETHCHTSQTSRCSRFDGGAMSRFYKSIGYDGICVTDHFFNGNTTVPREGDWRDRVGAFEAGYKAAKEAGDEIGLKVFFAWEYSIQGNDFLTYGLDADWLRATPEVMEWSLNEYLANVRSLGAFVTHAHPFRQAGYIAMIRLLPDLVDAAETDNSSMKDEINDRAVWYAEQYGLLKMSGSDNHWAGRERLAGCDFITSPADIGEMTSLMRMGDDGRSVQNGFRRFSLRINENGEYR